MPERRVPVLTDPSVTPDDLLVAAVLGDAVAGWRRLRDRLTALGLDLSWRHYRDGGWLCRAVRHGTNIAWLAVWDGTATVTCYVAERHREQLQETPALRPLCDQVARAELSGHLLPVVVEVRTSSDADLASELARAKLARAELASR